MNAASRAGDPPIHAGREAFERKQDGASPIAASNEPSSELLASLTGRDSGREAAVSHRTRRVVLSSLGLMREEKATRGRARGLALAGVILLPLLIAPLVWEATDSFIAGEHIGDPGSQISLWATIFCCTLLGAVLVAGWLKRRA